MAEPPSPFGFIGSVNWLKVKQRITHYIVLRYIKFQLLYMTYRGLSSGHGYAIFWSGMTLQVLLRMLNL